MNFKNHIRSYFINHAFSTSDITQPTIYLFGSFIGLQLIDILLGNAHIIGNSIKNGISTLMQNRMKKIELNKYITPNPSASIEFYRDYGNTDENQVYIDSILNHISELNSVIRLQRRKIYIVNSFEPFDITPDIKGRIKNISIKDKQIEEIWFEIYSYTISLADIRDWIDNIYERYKTDMQTGFGKFRYFFNHQSSHVDMNISNHICFDMTKFYTNKSLENLFGSHIVNVKNRLNMFQNKKSWYENKGIPYTFGLLLYGSPGCGKTSLIKAIANDTNRHIVNIKLTNNLTLTQLRNLFYNEKMKIISDLNSTPYYISIPVDQRIYVMEDVDCLTDILNQRDTKNKNKNQDDDLSEEDKRNIKLLGKDRWKQLKQLNNDTITLSDVLNIIDGVLETPGRILILTSNFPDKLDKALLRPGRIDLIVHFKECDTNQLKDMFVHFYQKDLELNFSELDDVYVPAYVQEIFLRYLNDPLGAFDYLLKNKQEYLNTRFQYISEYTGI